MTDKFYRIADAVTKDNPDPDIYALVLDAVKRGYNLRAIEEWEGEASD